MWVRLSHLLWVFHFETCTNSERLWHESEADFGLLWKPKRHVFQNDLAAKTSFSRLRLKGGKNTICYQQLFLMKELSMRSLRLFSNNNSACWTDHVIESVFSSLLMLWVLKQAGCWQGWQNIHKIIDLFINATWFKVPPMTVLNQLWPEMWKTFQTSCCCF